MGSEAKALGLVAVVAVVCLVSVLYSTYSSVDFTRDQQIGLTNASNEINRLRAENDTLLAQLGSCRLQVESCRGIVTELRERCEVWVVPPALQPQPQTGR